VIFNDEGLEMKVNQFGEARNISWQEIENITIHTNDVEISTRPPDGPTLRIPLGSYVINQQMKKLFKDYADRNNIEVL
jgi:hypothetical protein